jgi:hypothetical protein
VNLVINADGLVLMESETAMPTPPEGGAVIKLTAEQEAAYHAVTTQPNRGVTFIDGVFTPLPPLPPPSFPNQSSEGLIERRARAAARRGDDLTAIKLRMGVR